MKEGISILQLICQQQAEKSSVRLNSASLSQYCVAPPIEGMSLPVLYIKSLKFVPIVGFEMHSALWGWIKIMLL